MAFPAHLRVLHGDVTACLLPSCSSATGDRQTIGVHGALGITGQGLRGVSLIIPLTSAETPGRYGHAGENRARPLQAKPYVKAHR